MISASFLVLWADDIDQEGNSARVSRSLQSEQYIS